VSKVRPKYVKNEEEEAQEKESGDGNANNANYDLLLFDKKVSLAAEDLEPFFDKIRILTAAVDYLFNIIACSKYGCSYFHNSSFIILCFRNYSGLDQV
jgi:hypothetical protein